MQVAATRTHFYHVTSVLTARGTMWLAREVGRLSGRVEREEEETTTRRASAVTTRWINERKTAVAP